MQRHVPSCDVLYKSACMVCINSLQAMCLYWLATPHANPENYIFLSNFQIEDWSDEGRPQLTFHQCIHSRVELFLGFFFLASKKLNNNHRCQIFSRGCLGLGSCKFFVLFFLYFASHHSATHASILLYVYVCAFVCVDVISLWCSRL